MTTFLAVIVIAIVVALLVALKSKQVKPGDGLAFISRDILFTPAERSFLGVLEQALDTSYRVFGKVRLGDIVKPAGGLTRSKQTTARNRINQKHVDFVICTATDLALVGVLELDDKSHGREDRIERDDFVNLVLMSANIPVVHFLAKRSYTVQEVRARLAEILPAAAAAGEGRAATVQTAVTAVQQHSPAVLAERPPVQPETTVSACPACEADMVKRQAVKGEHAGKWFWACSAFPACRQVVEIGES